MNEALLNTGVAVFIIYAIVSIAYQVSAYRATVAVRRFIMLSSGDLQAVLAQLRVTLENFGKISDNVTVVSGNVREITSVVANLRQEVKTLYGSIKDRAGAEAKADFAGLKAGIRTGVATLVKGMKEERSGKNEKT